MSASATTTALGEFSVLRMRSILYLAAGEVYLAHTNASQQAWEDVTVVYDASLHEVPWARFVSSPEVSLSQDGTLVGYVLEEHPDHPAPTDRLRYLTGRRDLSVRRAGLSWWLFRRSLRLYPELVPN